MKNASVIALSVLFFVAGILHFTHGTQLASITPLPYALPVVWLTGVMEFVFVVFLLQPRFRRSTGILLSLFCLAVLPANINMALNDLPMFGSQLEPFWAWFRVAMQFPLILWILWATGFWRTAQAPASQTAPGTVTN